MPQCYFWIDGMATGHAENLQVRVITVTFIHLQINKEDANKRSGFPT